MLESAVKKRNRLQFKLDEEIAKAQKKVLPLQEDLEKAQRVVDIYAPKDADGNSIPQPYTPPEPVKKAGDVELQNQEAAASQLPTDIDPNDAAAIEAWQQKLKAAAAGQ